MINEIDLKIYPDKILSEKCENIDFEKDDWKGIASTLIACLYAYKGIGLAGPQIGILKNIFVIDYKWRGNKENKYKNINIFINPKIINSSIEDILSTEACLSVPAISGLVYRQKEIMLEYFDENKNKIQKTFSDILSRIIQHELDHLDGLLFIDKISENQRKAIASKLFSIRRHKKIKNF